jgi:hypothetical protein
MGRPRAARSWRALRDRAHRGAERLAGVARRLAEQLAYRPREVTLVALLSAGLLGGLGVARWQAAYPALAARLEAEPSRPAAAPAPPPARPRSRPAARGGRPECPGPGEVGDTSRTRDAGDPGDRAP